MVSTLSYKILFLLVNAYTLSPTTHASESTLLEVVCSKVKNADFCLHVFGSYPSVRTADLPELGTLAIDKARDKAAATKHDIVWRLSGPVLITNN
ncbi:invertase inhibitor [Dorcoceras hygrometricum]|uniref:Invertase inhibitor n=1 Tax=Dorcoceras hygrometricum TaxID=472368 RepID=A0A2Z6ZXR6_9LAMI|nr:invertase inhibitor [Dorcoceras hygrometricum]